MTKKKHFDIVQTLARMVELVDTLVSGTRAFTGVQVQVLFRAYNPVFRLDFFYALKLTVCPVTGCGNEKLVALNASPLSDSFAEGLYIWSPCTG